MSDPELTRHSAVELARLLRTRAVSPTEVLDAHLAVISRINPRLNAIVTLAEDQARAAARSAEARIRRGEPLGPLEGLPVVIKDVTLTAGIRTTFCSPLYRDFVPSEDAEVVTRLRKAGAIILGKTNTPEFATGANTSNELFGPTRNPWNPSLSPAGSSGGSAVAVATGMAPLAQGTDFGCSIRIPASFCGIVGLRTTAGLIPNAGMHLPWDPGQVHGPLARSADDAALMLDAMAGFDPLWPISVAPAWENALAEVQETDHARGKRIAYVTDLSGIGVEPEIDAICRTAAERLQADGAVVDEITFDVSAGIAAYKTLRGEWMVGQQFDRLDQIDRFGPNLAGNVRHGLTLHARDIAAAEHLREQTWMKFRALFQHYDFLMTPAAPVPPYPVEMSFPNMIGGQRLDDYVDWIAPAFLITLVGFPAVSVPAGMTASRLPVGAQVIGRRLSDAQLLGLARLVHRKSTVSWPPITSFEKAKRETATVQP